MKENVVVAKIISVKQDQMLPQDGMNIVASKNSEPAKHLYQFSEHSFNWKILTRVPDK